MPPNSLGRGAAPSGPLPLKPEDVAFIAIHCSASPPSQDIGVAEIDRMHRLRGFLSCGYHYVIRRDGTVEDGRALNQRGAHVEGFNHCSIGICLVGGVSQADVRKPEANFTADQMAALKSLLIDLWADFPSAHAQGHRDFPNVAKACPSFDVAAWLRTGELR